MIYNIGLDISLTATGIAVFNEDNNLVGHTTIKIKNWNNQLDRYLKIWTAIYEYINNEVVKDKSIYDVKCNFYIEGYSMNSRGRNVLQIAENAGIIKYNLYKTCYTGKIVIIPPATAKKLISGNGRADKPMMKKAIEEKGLFLNTEHEIDAAAMFIAYNMLSIEDKNKYMV